MTPDIRALEASGLRPVINRHVPLEELVAAFWHQAGRRHFGKIELDLRARRGQPAAAD